MSEQVHDSYLATYTLYRDRILPGNPRRCTQIWETWQRVIDSGMIQGERNHDTAQGVVDACADFRERNR